MLSTPRPSSSNSSSTLWYLLKIRFTCQPRLHQEYQIYAVREYQKRKETKGLRSSQDFSHIRSIPGIFRGRPIKFLTEQQNFRRAVRRREFPKQKTLIKG